MSDDLEKMTYPEKFLDTVRVFQTERRAPEKFKRKRLEVYDNGHFAEYAKELNLEIDTVVGLVRIAGPDVAAMNHWLDTANYLPLAGVPPREMLKFPNGEVILCILLGRVERGLFFERFDWVKEKKKKLGVDNLLKDWDKE